MTSFEVLRSILLNTLNRIFTINFGGVTYIFAIAWLLLIIVFIRSFKK